MFDYLESGVVRGLKVAIGNYISHQFIWRNESNQLFAVDEVNSLSRIEMARDFINDKTAQGKYKITKFYKGIREYDEDELCSDIAHFIDQKIPKHYFIQLYERDNGRSDRTYTAQLYKGIKSITGLRFHYKENYDLECYWDKIKNK